MKIEELRRRLIELGYKSNIRNMVKADLVKEYLDSMNSVNIFASHFLVEIIRKIWQGISFKEKIITN